MDLKGLQVHGCKDPRCWDKSDTPLVVSLSLPGAGIDDLCSSVVFVFDNMDVPRLEDVGNVFDDQMVDSFGGY